MSDAEPGPTHARRATITDVARASGTSIKTVSRVFNDEPFVRAETKAKVLEAARHLDYHPNIAARSLVRGRSSLIGLFYENPSPNYVVDLQTGALDRLHVERFQLLLFPCERTAEVSGRLLKVARASGLEGLILAPPIGDDARTLRELSDARIPFVRIAPTTAPEASPSVSIDDVAAAREMTRRLVELGHRAIGFVQGDPTHPSSAERLQGYREALSAAGIAENPAWLDQGTYSFDSGVEAGRRLFARTPLPTAVFAANDDMAAGLLVAANERGLAVPGQISVAGFDDSLISRVVWPQLTTVRQPTYDMARTATATLLAMIDRQPYEEHVRLSFDLLLRASTAPPR
jgi:LacI family transcriptional regulator